MKNVFVSVVSCFILNGCVYAKFKNEVSYFGEVDRDRGIAVAEKAQEMPWDETYSVQVFIETLPEGLYLEEGGSKLSVGPGFEKKFKVLGTVTSKYDSKANLNGLYWLVENTYAGIQLLKFIAVI